MCISTSEKIPVNQLMLGPRYCIEGQPGYQRCTVIEHYLVPSTISIKMDSLIQWQCTSNSPINVIFTNQRMHLEFFFLDILPMEHQMSDLEQND
jgi:hypothetical protein